MKRPQTKIFLTAALLFFTAFLTIQLPAVHADWSGAVVRSGHVTVRGLVLGESGRPIFAEYDKENNPVRVIAEAAGAYEGAFVISGITYCSYNRKYLDYMEKYGQKGGKAEKAYLMTEETFEDPGTVFQTVPSSGHEDPLVIEKPVLTASTLSVLVMHSEKLVHRDMNPVLLEIPVNLLTFNTEVTPETGAVLLDRKGNYLDRAKYDIGYRTAYYKEKGADISDTSKDSAVLYEPGFERVAPVEGALVTCGAKGRGITHDDGKFTLVYHIPPCPGGIYEYPTTVWAQLAYRKFNPKTKYCSYATFPVGVSTFDTCVGLGYGGTELGAAGMAAVVSQMKASDTAKTNFLSHDIRTDVIMLRGQAVFENPGNTPAVTVGDKTAYEAGYSAGEKRWPDPSAELGDCLVKGTLWDTGSDYLYAEPASVWDADKDGLHDIAVADSRRRGIVSFYGRDREPYHGRANLTRNAEITELEEPDTDMTLTPDLFENANVFVYRTEPGPVMLLHREQGLSPDEYDDKEGVYRIRLDRKSEHIEEGMTADIVLTRCDESGCRMRKVQASVKVTEYHEVTGPEVAVSLKDNPLKGARYEFIKPAPPENRGLLKTVSREDLKDTDIYIFRRSDGHIVAEHVDPLEDRDVAGDPPDPPLVSFGVRVSDSRKKISIPRDIFTFHSEAQTEVPEHLKTYDRLLTGGQVTAVVISRPTGYIGTAVLTIGGTAGSGKGNFLDYNLGKIVLRPPNLKIHAERTYDAEKGLTAGKKRENLISFEGSGLTSDKIIRVKTIWSDHDGTALPETLPGYTGRLAKVVRTNEVVPDRSDAELFDIVPGTYTQLLKLKGDLGRYHFYVQVCGRARHDNPSFATDPDYENDDILKYRPEKYVPILVPVFNSSETIKNAYASALVRKLNWNPDGPSTPVIRNIERVYDFVYRPEMQFSVFEWAYRDLKISTEYDYAMNRGVTVLESEYDLLMPENPEPADPGNPEPLAPLERYSGERQFLLGLGYGEFIVYMGLAHDAEMPNLEDLAGMMPGRQRMVLENAMSLLEPEDYLGLQLYQADDPGNGLSERFEFPLLIADTRPVVLKQRHYNVLYDATVPSDISSIINDYHAYTFALVYDAEVSAGIKNGQGMLIPLIGKTMLPR
ncbi:MAG: hypothetical protein GY820_22025, partial [Gammaproteobacteria bacterium]|nr:hypothetical protein [Gammaproteobacteria bacterium]